MDKYIYGADTETVNGEPLSIQFYSEDVACDDIYFVNAKTATDKFLQWCDKRKRDVQHVVYVHNLQFDLPELLYSVKHKLVSGGGEFDFKIRKWNVRGVYGAPTFCRLSNGHNVTIWIVDSFSWFRGSLEKGAELFCPDLPKLKRPAQLGEIRFKSSDTKFCEYAMRDAVVAYHMGKAIQDMHAEYDIQQTVSVADMAARIFRHRFLDYTIPQPSRAVVEASLLSYHGGKNNVTVDAGWFEDVTSVDISSAYPDAMHELPAFANKKLYRRYSARTPKQVHPHGVYCISGVVDSCQWPVIFSHGFKPLSGKIDRVWVQGFELNEALRSGEFKPTKITGHLYDSERDNQAPALRNFVDHFYKLKERETDKVRRYMQKLQLNSISGKLIQTRKRSSCAYTDIDADTTVTASELIAGGMFHPFIASAVTAHTRARIHRLEHRYKALHTATDGIMTKMKAKAEGRGLGALTLEAKGATLLLIRNKCYVLYSAKKIAGKTIPSTVFKNKHILKYALHGFQGSVTELERMVATGRRRYSVTRPNRLKESIKHGKQVNLFERRDYSLKIGPLSVS